MKQLMDDLYINIYEKDSKIEKLEQMKEALKDSYEVRLHEKEENFEEAKNENEMYVR